MIHIRFPRTATTEDTVLVRVHDSVAVMTTTKEEKVTADRLVDILTPVYRQLANQFGPFIDLEVTL